MSSYLFDQKPELDDLEHFGVKGMKWGVRKSRTGAQWKERRRRQRKASNVATLVALGTAAAGRMAFSRGLQSGNPNMNALGGLAVVSLGASMTSVVLGAVGSSPAPRSRRRG